MHVNGVAQTQTQTDPKRDRDRGIQGERETWFVIEFVHQGPLVCIQGERETWFVIEFVHHTRGERDLVRDRVRAPGTP
jgi:hypothetical protein